jgi:hypothetical protein
MHTFLKMVALTAVVLSPVAAAAKDKKQVTGLELQQIQSRDFEVPKGTAFSAVMSVLQDEGYRIGSADKDTGLITGTASTETKTTWMPFVGFGKKKRTPVVSAYIEDRSATMSRIRLNFVMGRYNASQYGASEGERPITDPIVYKDAFEKIEQAIFVRQAMDAVPAAPKMASTSAAPESAPGTATASVAATAPVIEASAPQPN